MKKFLLKIFLFALLLFPVNLKLFLISEKYLRKEQKVDLSYSSYLLSDSHGNRLGNKIEKLGIFNFSQVSDSYLDIERKLYYLIRESGVKQVILTVDNHMLSPYRKKNNNHKYTRKYMTFMESEDKYSYFIEEIIMRYFPLLCADAIKLSKKVIPRQIGDIFSTKSSSSKLSETDKEELAWHELSDRAQQDLCSKRFDLQFSYPKPSDFLKNRLERIIQLCQKHHIQMKGIKFPLPECMISTLNGKDFEADEFLRSKGIKVYDFSKVLMHKDYMFTDADHLHREHVQFFIDNYFKQIID